MLAGSPLFPGADGEMSQLACITERRGPPADLKELERMDRFKELRFDDDSSCSAWREFLAR